MTATQARRPAAVPSDGPAPELAEAIAQLPAFLRAPIFTPTERVPLRDAIAGLARVRALYDHDLELVYRPRLRALRAARHDRRCFILGNGPSLARTDLSRLKGEVTFATNSFFLKLAEHDWSPTYYVVEDHLVGEDRADELNRLGGTTKLFPASLAYALRPDENTVYFDHRPRPSYPDGFDFSFDADVSTFTGGTVTFTCMQLAAFFGFQEIYLIGVDADYSIPRDAALSGNGRVKVIDMASDDPNHFHPDYFGKGKRWHEPNVETMLAAYAEARRATEARGVSIVNATVGGRLEGFPRADYETLFRPAPAERLLVIDHTQMGNTTATGAVKSALLGGWPSELLMQVYDQENGALRIAGSAAATERQAPIDSQVEIDSHADLDRQIAAFEPDLVLYRPVPRQDALHDFAMDLITRTNLPLALWIVDDWPSVYALEDPVRAARLEADLRWLLVRADARFSISSAMSEAFHERYGQPFVPIANGVDPADWAPAQRRAAAHVTVRYAGSLAENMTLDSVRLVARAIESLARSGVDISFEIKTTGHWLAASGGWMRGLRHTHISATALSVAEYRRWLAEAGILLIAYNFDDRSRDYIRYSLANKLPECLASGAAVVAVGPKDAGTIVAMAALDVGERLTVANERLIGQTLRRLAASSDERFDLARRGQAVAFSRFNLSQTRQAFASSVCRVARAHQAGEYPRDLHAHVDETDVIASLVGDRRGPGHVMLDVGAHSGSSAIHFDPLGWTVRCFEPHPTSRDALAGRFAGHQNVHIDPRAVGESSATDVPLYESSESSGIATLQPFRASHRPAAVVDVTTISDVVAELGLSRVDFLKIDVEGLDLAVLRGVPWSQLRPDVVECEFEDIKTLALGHSWRDIAAYLWDRGYTVYVSEWHPITRYGRRHDWRRVAPFGPDLDVHPSAWGNLLAFQEDPGWPAVRRAFDRLTERGAARLDSRPDYAAAPTVPATARPKRRVSAPLRVLGLARRASVHLLRRPRATLSAAAVLALWTLLGFAVTAPASWLIWGTAGLFSVALVSLYATYRVNRRSLATARELAALRRAQKAQQVKLSEVNQKLRRLERELAEDQRVSAELLRRIGQDGNPPG